MYIYIYIYIYIYAETLITSEVRCRTINVKLLAFGVNIKLDTNTKILMITELRNSDFIKISHTI